MKRKIYITKYALTQGIIEADATFNDAFDTTPLATYGVGRKAYFHKGQYFLDKNEAIIQANLMRDKRIKSLMKELNKIEKLKFNL